MRARTPISELELTHSHNLGRAKSLPPKKVVAKRAELEAMWKDLTARRDDALAEVKRLGVLLKQDKFSARGELYWVWTTNPCLKIAQATEKQMITLARLLTEEDGSARKSAAQLLRETEEMLGSAN